MFKNKLNKQSILVMLIVFAEFTLLPEALAWDRIVVLNPMVAEWSAEILGAIDAGKKIVGVSEFSNFPEQLKSVSSVGPYPQPLDSTQRFDPKPKPRAIM